MEKEISDQLPSCKSIVVEYPNGTKEWYLDNKLHRLDGPAIEDAYGNKFWYLDGKLHRLDGLAIEDADDGTKYWYNDNYVNYLCLKAKASTIILIVYILYRVWSVPDKEHLTMRVFATRILLFRLINFTKRSSTRIVSYMFEPSV